MESVIAAEWGPDPCVFDIYDKQNTQVVVNCCEFHNQRDVPDYGVLADAQIEPFVSLMNKHHAAREAIVLHCCFLWPDEAVHRRLVCEGGFYPGEG